MNKQKEYYEQHKEAILQRVRDYAEKNKDAIKERGIQYRAKHKEQIQVKKSEKHVCSVCGVEYTAHHKARHERSQKHIKALEQ